MTIGKDIHVKIGEVKIGREGDILRATLGSCVGIVFSWKEKKIFGLAHCLLPESPQSSSTIGAKFVSQAVPSLIALLKIKPENAREIEVYIVGGGNMMFQLSKSNVSHIGLQNIAAARKYLHLNGFKVRELELGGDDGRQVYVDCTSGKVSVVTFSKGRIGV